MQLGTVVLVPWDVIVSLPFHCAWGTNWEPVKVFGWYVRNKFCKWVWWMKVKSKFWKGHKDVIFLFAYSSKFLIMCFDRIHSIISSQILKIQKCKTGCDKCSFQSSPSLHFWVCDKCSFQAIKNSMSILKRPHNNRYSLTSSTLNRVDSVT